MGNRSRTLALGNRPQSPKQVGGTSASGFSPIFFFFKKSHCVNIWAAMRRRARFPAPARDEYEWRMTNGEYGERAADSVQPGGLKCCDAPCFTERQRTALCRKGQPERGQRRSDEARKSVVGVRVFPTYQERATGASVPSPSAPSDWGWSSAGNFSGSSREGEFRFNKPFPVKRKPKRDSDLREWALDLQELIDSPEHQLEFLLRPLKQLGTNNHDLTV